jgi:fibronectin type 3 domain-containing protein
MNRIGNLIKSILIFGSLIILGTFSPNESFAFILPDTGQTLCYDSSGNVIDCTGTGQDGAYDINPMTFVDNGNGTVTDNNTGLMWQKDDNGNRYSWYQALSRCSSLTLGGHSDWRLPTKKELMSIADYSIPPPGPMIMTTYFPKTWSAWYWSSTTDAGNPDQAWYVDFYNGDVGVYDKDYPDHVRCVRGGQPSSPDFADNGNGTVTDYRTGFMWQKGEAGSMTWSSALSYCEGLNLGGHSDWRLPNIKELESITDDTTYNPAIDTTFFPGVMWNYWSSTTDAGSPDLAWYVHFYGGFVSNYNSSKPSSFYVRCLRGRPETNPPIGSITIEGGAEATDSTAVTLTLAATDDSPGAIQMCISNTASCTTWIPFATTKSWTLTTGDGTKTVNVWFQDFWDNVTPTPYSDTIILDTIAPSNGTVTATPGDTQVKLDWTGFTDAGSGIESYKVVYAVGTAPTSCSGTAIYSGINTTYTHTGLTNGTTYYYRVCAIDTAENMSTGATASAKPRPESNPPTGSITIEGGAEATKSTAVNLTLAATDDSPGAIQMCISNTATCAAWTAFAPTKSWTLTTGNGTKTVNVWFQDVWDNVNPTPYSDTIILDTVPPANGTVTATPSDTQVKLDWTGFTDAGSGIESYKVVYAKDSVPASCSGTAIYSGTNTTYTHTGLTNATYYYRVCAIDKAENMSTGATASAKPIRENNPPTGSIMIKGGAEATKSTAVTLTLTATDDTAGAIRMCVSNTATCTTWTAFAPTKSWTLTSGNGTKTVNVWFQDVWDNVTPTPYSDTIILDTIGPTNGTLTATPGDTQVTLDWTGFMDAGSGIESYKVVYAKGSVPLSCSVGTVIYSGTALSTTHTGLTNGTKYGYRVCAKDKAGNVSTGATATATPQ